MVGLRLRAPGTVQADVALSVDAVEGWGLAGDVHGSPDSPRQVLLAGEEAYADLHLPPNELRESILLDLPTSTLGSGTILRLGQHALLWLTLQCEPCGRLDQATGSKGRQIGCERGVLARVVRSGRIALGDAVFMRPSVLPTFSDRWQDRVLAVAEAVPDGLQLDYVQLARLAGVARSYCRAFPRVLRALPSGRSGSVRTVGDVDPARRWSGASIFDHRVDGRSADLPFNRRT